MNIAVVGTGTMALQIATIFSLHGDTVFIHHRRSNADFLSTLARQLKIQARKSSVGASDQEAALQRIKPVTDWQLLRDCELVIEAVVEDLKTKQQLFQQMEIACSNNTILATNTSSLSISKIASQLKDRSRVIGLHFFNPISAIELVEVITTPDNSQDCIDRALRIVEGLGKTPLLVPESYVNRILFPMINEAALILEREGVSIEDIDRCMKLGAHHPIGPLALADLIGLDIVVSILYTLEERLGPRYHPAPKLLSLVTQKHLGRKTGRGFFSYGRS